MADIKEGLRHLRIYGLFISNCFMAQMEYRFNFLMAMVVETGWLLAKILYIIVIYNTGVVIKGLPPDAMLMFIGTYVFLTGIFCGFFAINFVKISEYISSGMLDIYITKPVSLMFMVTLRQIDLGMPIPDMIGGIVMIVIGWQRLGIPVDMIHITGFVVFIISGIVISYALFLLPQLVAFFTIKTSGINELSYSLWDFNNMPMMIYDQWIQRIGTFIVPIFLVSNFSTLFVLGRLGIGHALWGIAAPVVLFYIVRKLWKLALRNYSSAN